MEASAVPTGSRTVVAPRQEGHDGDHPRARGSDARVSVRSKLRAALEIERSGDGIELEARFRARVDARLRPEDREVADDGLARLKASVSARIEIEISAEDNPDGLAAALGQLAQSFSGAVDSLQRGIAGEAGSSLADLLGGLREAFGGLLAGLGDAFAASATDALGGSAPEADDGEPTAASGAEGLEGAPVASTAPAFDALRPGDATRGTASGSSIPPPVEAAPPDSRDAPPAPPVETPPGLPLHHRHEALRRELELRFVASLRALVSRLSDAPAPPADSGAGGAAPVHPLRETARLDLHADLRARFVDLRG